MLEKPAVTPLASHTLSEFTPSEIRSESELTPAEIHSESESPAQVAPMSGHAGFESIFKVLKGAEEAAAGSAWEGAKVISGGTDAGDPEESQVASLFLALFSLSRARALSLARFALSRARSLSLALLSLSLLDFLSLALSPNPFFCVVFFCFFGVITFSLRGADWFVREVCKPRDSGCLESNSSEVPNVADLKNGPKPYTLAERP